ncbi:MAG: glycosyltransferase [Desulfobacteraceae bacterium]|nr:glycosyltransferase [Desulfobacteraceae bacterium]
MLINNPYEKFNPFEDDRLVGTPIKMPLVSLIITNYNYARYIGQCIRSIDKQTYNNFHCVVVDDCSTDDSVQVIEKAFAECRAAEKFTLIPTETNGGQMAAMKKGMGHAKGPFVVMVDADDYLLNDFIHTHLKAHLGRVTVALTSSIQYQIDENGEIIGGNHHDNQNNGTFRHIYHTQFHHPFWLWATSTSIMFRKAALELAMPSTYHDHLRICADNYLVHFCNLIGGSLLIPSIHGCYRRHGQNGFGKNRIIGGHLPVGDMSEHPEHDTVHKIVVERLFEIAPQLKRLLGKGGFMNLLMRTTFIRELPALKKRYPDVLTRPLSQYRREFIRFRYLYKYWGWQGKVRKLITSRRNANG